MLNKKKRLFLKKALILSSFPFLSSCDNSKNITTENNVIPRPYVKLKMATSFPKNLPGADIPAQRLVKKIYDMSNGRIKIKHHAAGELIPAFEVFDAVRSGAIDCGVSAPYYWASKNKAIPFFCAIPGGMTAKEKFIWLQQSNGQFLWDQLYSLYNLKGLPAGNTGTTMGGWFNKEINDIKDFKGIKMRIPGMGGEIINRMGGVAVNIPGSEIITSLKLGVLDAAEWAGPWPDMIMGFHKVAKFYYGPGIHEPGTLNEFVINKGIWDSLSLENKSIITNACYANYLEGLSEYFYKNAKASRVLKEKHNIKIKNFPKKVIKKMLSLSNEIVLENANKDPQYKKIYDSWYDAKKLFNEYHAYSDHEYLNLRIKNSSVT